MDLFSLHSNAYSTKYTLVGVLRKKMQRSFNVESLRLGNNAPHGLPIMPSVNNYTFFLNYVVYLIITPKVFTGLLDVDDNFFSSSHSMRLKRAFL